MIEDPGREQQSWIAAIRLNLSITQAASAKRWIDGRDQPTSLEGVGRNERCAGFYGHELVHAFLIFENPGYARLYQEYKRETAAYYLARKSMTAKEYGNDPEIQKRMQRLQSLMDQLEEPANSVESDRMPERFLRDWAREEAGTFPGDLQSLAARALEVD